jgi:preprotein translocase subunit SecD
MVLRSYLLQQPAFVTAADVESTYVGAEDGKNYVAVTLRAAGAARLRDVTGSHKGGRLAILFDGSVEMAPVVRSEITDGHVSISLWKDATREEAEGLAAGLRGDLWHGG